MTHRRKQYAKLITMYTLNTQLQYNRRITIVFAIFRNCFLLSEIKLEQRHILLENV